MPGDIGPVCQSVPEVDFKSGGQERGPPTEGPHAEYGIVAGGQ